MMVRELIENLMKMNQDAEVVAFDADAGETVPVTGLLFDERSVTIQTDEP